MKKIICMLLTVLALSSFMVFAQEKQADNGQNGAYCEDNGGCQGGSCNFRRR